MIDRARLARLMRPQTIAVVGGRYAEEVVRQCQRIGFDGTIWPVNPRRDQMSGIRCFSSLDQLPGTPDAVFVGLAREATIDAVRQLRELQVGGVVALASGYAELDERGRALQQALVEAAGDMPVAGPNCYGVLNYLDGAALWPDQNGGDRIDRGVAIIAQSGNIALTLSMQDRSVPLAYIVSVGNQAVLTIGDYIDTLVDDERVTAIGIHVEGLNDIDSFARAATRALEAGKPIVAIKSGRSVKGAKTALSHTSSLTGSDQLYSALFARYGVARVEGLTTFLETLKLLHVHGALPGNRIASMSCSGGEAGLVADLADELSLSLPPFAPTQSQRLHAVLGDRVVVDNPLDYHTYIWANEEALGECFGAVLAGDVDAAMLLMDYPVGSSIDTTDWLKAERALANAHRQSGNRPLMVATLPECLPGAVRTRLLEQGIAPMQGLGETLHAIRAAAAIGAAQRLPPPPPPLVPSASPGDAQVLDEHAAKQLLAQLGIAIPDGRLTDADTAVTAAAQIGYPVVVKAACEDLLHKTELGAVRLGLDSDAAVAGAVGELSALSDRFLVESMVGGALAEILVGITRDDQFGPTLVIGAGGIQVELFADAVTLLLPVTRDEIRYAIRSLKVFPLLDGFRGTEPADVDALVDTALRVANYAVQHKDTLVELDINPVLVLAQGQGAVAADALIRQA